jgi:hypothetical protein
MTERFLSRWARLKRAREQAPVAPQAADAGRAAQGEPASNPASNPAPDQRPESASVAALQQGSLADVPTSSVTAATKPPADPNLDLPPLDTLTTESDFTPFLRNGVAPAARSAALRKLFTDPRFNVMDGLDVYIEDFGKTEAIPDSMLRGLAQSRSLGLFDEPFDGQSTDATPGEAEGAGAIGTDDRQPAAAESTQAEADVEGRIGVDDNPPPAGEADRRTSDPPRVDRDFGDGALS